MTNTLRATGNISGTASLRGFTALIITTDEALANTIESTLSSLSVSVTVAESMFKAAQAIEQGLKPIAILIDLSADHSLKFVKELKSRPQYARFPIVAMTEDPSLPEVKSALEAGANRWITKRFVGNTLVAVMRQFSTT